MKIISSKRERWERLLNTLTFKRSDLERTFLSREMKLNIPRGAIILEPTSFDEDLVETCVKFTEWSKSADEEEIYRGELAQHAVKHILYYERILHCGHPLIAEDSELRKTYEIKGSVDFILIKKDSSPIALEIKSVKEGTTKRGEPNKRAFIKEGIMNADYLIPVKIHYRPDKKEPIIIIWGYKTKDEIERLPLNYYYNPPCKIVYLDKPMGDFSSLLNQLKEECVRIPRTYIREAPRWE